MASRDKKAERKKVNDKILEVLESGTFEHVDGVKVEKDLTRTKSISLRMLQENGKYREPAYIGGKEATVEEFINKLPARLIKKIQQKDPKTGKAVLRAGPKQIQKEVLEKHFPEKYEKLYGKGE